MRHLVLLPCALLALAGCGISPTGRPPEPLRLAQETDVLTLDPTLSEAATFSALSNVYEPLVTLGPDLSVQPALAARWNAPDERTWVFELRSGVLFHDGTPLRATDVTAALERARQDRDSVVKGSLGSVESVVVTGPRVVTVTTRRPDALLLQELAHVLVARGGSRAEIDGNPVGTGPYRVARWLPGRALDLEAFPGYWGGSPSVRRVSFVAAESGEASARALVEGRVDLALVSPSAARMTPAPFRTVTSQGLTTQFLWVDARPRMGGNPFADVRVRRALALALDRRALAEEATGTPSNAAEQLVPPTIFGYATGLPPPRFDPSGARAILAQTWPGGGPDVTLVHRDSESQQAVAARTARMLRTAGFRVTLRAVDWKSFLEAQRARSVSLYLSRWAFDGGDAGGFLRDCVRTPSAAPPAGQFNAGASSEALDRLIDQSLATLGDPERRALYEEIQRLAREEVPLVPLYNEPDVYGLSPRLVWTPRLDGRLLAAEMTLRADASRPDGGGRRAGPGR